MFKVNLIVWVFQLNTYENEQCLAGQKTRPLLLPKPLSRLRQPNQGRNYLRRTRKDGEKG